MWNLTYARGWTIASTSARCSEAALVKSPHFRVKPPIKNVRPVRLSVISPVRASSGGAENARVQ